MKKPEDFGIINFDKEKFEKTGILDCFQEVDLSNRNLEKLPFQFGIVNGYFDCSRNQIKSLEWCPKEVNGFFDCSRNQIKSLKGCPIKINENFYCYKNKLKSLEGCPKEVNGGFYCYHNFLKSLKGCPEKVTDYLSCDNNPFDMTVKEWINYLKKYKKSNLYGSCRIVSDNSTYDSTLKGLKEKLAILEAFD